MITDARMEKALTYLAETDEDCASLKADMERMEYKIKALKAVIFKMNAGKTVADRNAEADMHEDVAAAMHDHCEAIQAYHAMANKRTTEALVIDVWRSINANRRQS